MEPPLSVRARVGTQRMVLPRFVIRQSTAVLFAHTSKFRTLVSRILETGELVDRV